MSGVIPPLPLFAFMAPIGTSFCLELRFRLQFHISSFIVIYSCLSSHSFAPYPSIIPCLPFCFCYLRSPFLILIYIFYFSGLRFYLISCCIGVVFVVLALYISMLTFLTLPFPILLFLLCVSPLHACIYSHV